jgi:Rrf2 family iron-sulfur cluster assembly transcriptional regulator
MRLSTKGRYAVMAVVDLARHGRDRAVSLAEIAGRQEISLSYLEQLFARLRRAGVVVSVRGPGGGYRLARAAADIAVSEIVLAVDEPIRATRCSGEGDFKGCMLGGERCLTHDLWEELGHEIHRYLAGVSVEDVVERRVAAKRTAGAESVAAA